MWRTTENRFLQRLNSKIDNYEFGAKPQNPELEIKIEFL